MRAQPIKLLSLNLAIPILAISLAVRLGFRLSRPWFPGCRFTWPAPPSLSRRTLQAIQAARHYHLGPIP